MSHNGPLDINRATKEDLQSLENIGPARADAILKWRRETGPLNPDNFRLIPDIPATVWDIQIEQNKVTFDTPIAAKSPDRPEMREMFQEMLLLMRQQVSQQIAENEQHAQHQMQQQVDSQQREIHQLREELRGRKTASPTGSDRSGQPQANLVWDPQLEWSQRRIIQPTHKLDPQEVQETYSIHQKQE